MNKVAQAGQSTVEYMLMLFVILSLVMLVFRNPLLAELFDGDDPQSLFSQIKNSIQFSYRHTYSSRLREQYPPSYQVITHPSYYNEEINDTRFFGPAEAYPGGIP